MYLFVDGSNKFFFLNIYHTARVALYVGFIFFLDDLGDLIPKINENSNDGKFFAK